MCAPSTLKERFEEKYKGVFRWIYLNCKNEIILSVDMNTLDESILAFIQKELTTQKNEIVEMIDSGQDVRENELKVYSGEHGSVLSNRNPYQEGYNQAKKDIKSKILNK